MLATTALTYHKILPSAIEPTRATEKSVGYDLASALDYLIQPREYVRIRTGLSLKPPYGMWIMVALRSSLGKQLMLTNGVGIIDPDYCGPEDEVMIAVRNLGMNPVEIKAGQRIAQAILLPLLLAPVVPSEPSFENRGGFGSTGLV